MDYQYACFEVGHEDGEGCRYRGFAAVEVEHYQIGRRAVEMASSCLPMEVNTQGIAYNGRIPRTLFQAFLPLSRPLFG
jgi:hypothetical protein